jgi:beta-lactamase regulating signal transducer with metallopeptidase domain
MNALNNWVTSWFDAVLMMSLQGGLVILVILCLQKILWHRLTAGWRHAFWLLLFMSLLFPARFSSSFSIFQASERVYEFILGQETRVLTKRLHFRSGIERLRADLAHFDEPSLADVAIDPGVSVPEQEATVPSTTPIIVAKSSENQTRPSEMRHWSLGSLIAWVWGSGSVILFLVWLTSELRFRFRIRSCPEIEDRHVLDIFKHVRRDLKLGEHVSLVECSWIHGPAVAGWLRKTLLLPAGFSTTFDGDSKRHIFLHELAHIRRYDLETSAVMNFLLCLHWFNPLMWLAAWRMKIDRELAADAMALRYIDQEQRESYGETLIQLLSSSHGRGVLSGTLGMAESKAQLTQRMRAIASYRSGKGSFILGISCFLLVGGLVLSDTDEKGPSSKPVIAERVPVVAQYVTVYQQNSSGSGGLDREALTTHPDGPPHPVEVIRLKVVDDQTDEPVPVFKVYGWEIVQLRPLFTLEGKDGQLEIPKSAWELDDSKSQPAGSISLNIESDGYFSSHSEPLRGTRRNEGVLVNDVRMVSNQPFKGRIVTGEGLPAPGANVSFIDDKLKVLWNESPPRLSSEKGGLVALSDDSGTFEIGVSHSKLHAKPIIVTHSDGVFVGHLSRRSKDPVITLRSWGKLEGVVRLARRFGSDIEIVCRGQTSDSFGDVVSLFGLYGFDELTARTDNKGGYNIHYMVPGTFQLLVGFKPQDGLNHVSHTVNVLPGKTAIHDLDLKPVRKVFGSIKLPDSIPEFKWAQWNAVGQAFSQELDISGLSGDPDSMLFQHRNILKQKLPLHRSSFFMDWMGDGDFQIHDVPPGDYDLFVKLRLPVEQHNNKWSDYHCRFHVPEPESEEVQLPALDLGWLKLEALEKTKKAEPLRIGDGPELRFSAFDSNGVDFGPGHFRGRYLLLHFWGVGDDENRDWQLELDKIHRRKSEFTASVVVNGVSEKRHRFEIITLGIGQDAMGLKNFVQDHPLEWKHGFMDGPAADDLMRQLGVDSQPAAVLLDRSGKVILSSSSVSDPVRILNEELDKMGQIGLPPYF